MDLIDRLKELSVKIPKLIEISAIKTEEGVKNALVMPFINALGYNVFDPLEVTPELVADVGIKKGEKVDYAILRDGRPIILFECKGFGVNLNDVHKSQLYRYFSVTEARFAVLTNGVQYNFYTDLDEPNKLDEKPFFIFDLTEVREPVVEALKRFTKSAFDENKIITTASEMKYRNAVKSYIEAQFNATDGPSEAFVKFCVQESKAYDGRYTQNVLDEFKPIVKEALRSFVSDQVEKRLKSALASEEAAAQVPSEVVEEPEPENKIVTTQEELDGYFVIKAIVREVIDVKRLSLRDTQSYCNVLVDNNIRKTLCRLHFNRSQKYLGLFNGDKSEERLPIEQIDDLYTYADRLKEAVKPFIVEQ